MGINIDRRVTEWDRESRKPLIHAHLIFGKEGKDTLEKYGLSNK